MDRNSNKARTANKVLPKAGLNGFDWTFALKIPAFVNTQTVELNLSVN